ncbi:IS200/IS605 family transposase [Candidatus Aerophobetes bacterium]|nr:IS200/IS605 family transposase [Candidatus Aerophobetes bacterium]
MKQNHWISARTCVYNIWYHVVWSTKYRRKVLVNKVADTCKELFAGTARENDFTIKAMEIMPDHVHLFISAHPKYAPSAIVKKLKGISGKWLFERHPELRKIYRKNKLWNPSTYYGTSGDVSKETIRKYIEMQRTGK